MDSMRLINDDSISTNAPLSSFDFFIYEVLSRRGWLGCYYKIGIPLFRRQSPLIQKWFSLSIESINQHQLKNAKLEQKMEPTCLMLHEIDKNSYGLRMKYIPLKYRRNIKISTLIGLIGPSEDSQMLVMRVRLSLITLCFFLFICGLLILIDWMAVIASLVGLSVVMIIAYLYARRDFLDFWDTLQNLGYRQDQ